MTLRILVYRAVCVLLGIYAVAAVAHVAQWTRGGVFESGPLLFFTVAHGVLLAMASLRAARPARTGSSGALLLTLAMALVIVASASVRIGPDWLPPARLVLLGGGYVAVRLTAPRAAPLEE
jgi:peptidoglycan/LPS O-acetylase OafA/YrhL